MSFSFKDLFRVNTSVNQFKNNHVKIETKTDIMFQIGKDLGEIKTDIKLYNNKINDIDIRLKKIEKIIFNKKK